MIIVLRTCAVLLVSCQDKSLVTIVQFVEIFLGGCIPIFDLHFHNFFLNIFSKLKLKPFGVLVASNVVVSVGRLFTEMTMLLNVRKWF